MKREYGLAKCTGIAVATVYKKNNIAYKQPGKTNRLSEEREKALVHERILFARRLKRLIDKGADICYMDETTFNIWDPPKRTWMKKDCRMVVPINL